MKKGLKLCLALVLLLAAAVLVVLISRAEKNEAATPEAGTSPTKDKYTDVVYNGKKYTYNPGLQTVLFMGIDDFGEAESSEVYLNNGQADFLMVAVIDNVDRTYSLIQINRDTMCKTPVLGLGGKVAAYEVMQLALAHTYGSGLEDSCENTVKAISHFLAGVPIDHYLSMNMDGVGVLNDAVDGVTVTVLDDFADEPRLKKGETVTLAGDLALTYVRGRMSTTEGTNISRMERHRQYIEEFLKQLDKKLDSESFVADTFYRVAEYTVTDMSVTQLTQIAVALTDYEFTGIRTAEGESVFGGEYMEFYADTKSLEKLIIDVFYKEK